MASCPLSFYDERVREMRKEIELVIMDVADELPDPMHFHAVILADIAHWFREVPTNNEINDRIIWQVLVATVKVLDKPARGRLAQEIVTAVINCFDERMWQDYIQPDYQS